MSKHIEPAKARAAFAEIIGSDEAATVVFEDDHGELIVSWPHSQHPAYTTSEQRKAVKAAVEKATGYRVSIC